MIIIKNENKTTYLQPICNLDKALVYNDSYGKSTIYIDKKELEEIKYWINNIDTYKGHDVIIIDNE